MYQVKLETKYPDTKIVQQTTEINIMAKPNPRNRSDKEGKASVPSGQSPSTTPVKKKKGNLDIRRYLMIGMVALAMLSFIFTSLPNNFGGRGGSSNTSNSSAADMAAAEAAAKAASEAATLAEPTFTHEGALSFKKADGTTIREIRMEVADDEPQRVKGMMYRKSIPNDTGMLFIFPETELRSFWMKNTYVPLDILFVAEDKTIINIHKNTPTLTEQNFPSTAPAKYVVEVAGGYTSAYGIEPGHKIEFSMN
jgi:uncharacterized protein